MRTAERSKSVVVVSDARRPMIGARRADGRIFAFQLHLGHELFSSRSAQNLVTLPKVILSARSTCFSARELPPEMSGQWAGAHHIARPSLHGMPHEELPDQVVR